MDTAITNIDKNPEIVGTTGGGKINIFSRPTSHAYVKRGGSNMMGNNINIIKNRASPDISKGIGTKRLPNGNYNS